jgi:general secretion pathway protein G
MIDQPVEPSARWRQQYQDNGFTLVEMLIVITILALLATVVVFAVTQAVPDGAKAACESNYKTVEMAAEAYKAQVGSYPTQFAQLTGTTTGLNGSTDGPWLKEAPDTYTPGAAPSISHNDSYGLAIDSSSESIAVGTIKGNGAAADTGTPLAGGNQNCAQA